MHSHESSVLIVGTGQAGATAAIELRKQGHAGPITLVGAEPHVPYQRPPLSKAFLRGDVEVAALSLKPAAFYAAERIELITGVHAASIDRDARRVVLDDGRALAYDVLVLATGARVRKLDIPGADLRGVFYLRDIDDADRLKAALAPGRTLVIVGGGYVGLEVAAAAKSMGLEVMVVEREPRLLARVASAVLGEFYEHAHRARGVDVRTNTRVMAFAGSDRVTGVVFDDGTELACDLAVVGIGAVAVDHLARAAKLPCENGVVVDVDARTEDPAIYAIGDVTWRPLPHDGHRHVRLESVPNAIEQARRATCSILGKPMPPHEVPWFWSDQFDLKLQIAGFPAAGDTTVLRGSVEAGKFALFHLRGLHLHAAEVVNSPHDFLGAKALIASGATVDIEKLRNADVKAKDAIAG